VVESALFFVIGFLCAALLALLATPAVSRRAMRLANARARLQAPLTESQARAERDALRAVQAVEIVKMEKKVASAEWERALARTDLARETGRLLKLDVAVQELDAEIQRRDELYATLQREIYAAEAEAGAKEVALLDLAGQRDIAKRRLAEARSAVVELQSHIDRDRVEIATLSTQVAAFEVELSDMRAGRRRFGGQDDADLAQRLRQSDTARADLTLELARLMRALAERTVALANAETARDDIERKFTFSEQRVQSVESELRTRLQALSTERAGGDSALSTERETRQHMQDEIEALKARLGEATASAETLARGDAALRLAIVKLGRDFVRSRAPQDDEPHGAAQIVNFVRREPAT
jgi:chromosome segregation ATPase